MKMFLLIFFCFFNFSFADVNKQIAKEALSILINNLKSNDNDLKAYSIELLGETKNTKIITILNKYLKEKNNYVKMAASKALWNLGEKDSIETIYSIINNIPSQSPVNDPLIELKNISQNKIREKAIDVMVYMLKDKAKEALIKLREEDPYPVIKDVASRELAKLGDKEELNGFYDAFNSNNEEVRLQTAEIFSKICPYNSNKLTDFLKKEKSSKVQMFLLKAISCSSDKDSSVNLLLKYVDDKNPTLRVDAVKALQNIKEKKVIDKLKLIYNDTPDLNVKVYALSDLLSINEIKPTIEEIKDMFSISNTDLKKEILSFYPYFDKKDFLSFLSIALNDTDPYIKAKSAFLIIILSSKK